MEDQMHYIDNFFQGLLSPQEAKTFEERITSDPAFAADVAFYITSRQVARELLEEEKKSRYKELFRSPNGYHQEKTTGKVRKMWVAVSASAVAAVSTAVIIGMFFLNNPSIQEVAQKYVTEAYAELPVKMGPPAEFENGVDLYNQKQYAQALAVFENLLGKDSSFPLLKYAGLCALNISKYDKSLRYFHQMENFPSQFSNPAVFLQAVTYMERNKTGDKEQAMRLLKKVSEGNLEGKEQADKWIKKFN